MTQLQPLTEKRQSSLSTEPIYVQISAQVPGFVPRDIHSDPVSFAFKPEGQKPNTPPSGGDWHTGTFVTVTTPENTTLYVAYVNVGPGGDVTLTTGLYVVWVYLDDELGQPVAQVGTLTITDL